MHGAGGTGPRREEPQALTRPGLQPPLTSGPAGQRLLALAVMVFGLCSVAPLLAWVFGLGSFAAWFWLLAAPCLLFIAALAVFLQRSDAYPALRVALVAGTIGGLLATLAYDVVRIPFVISGYALFAPIASYGVLLTNAHTSTPLTDMLGWAYNFGNGIGFGIAYAMFGLGRRWWWAIPYALALETMTIITPYANVYSIAGKLDVIAIAYGAHVFYGLALGRTVQTAGSWRGVRDAPIPAWWGLAGLAVVLMAWHQPWTAITQVSPAAGLQPQPAAVVSNGKFEPQWLRVGVNGCVLLDNHDSAAYQLKAPAGAPKLAAHARRSYCFPRSGVIRIQLNSVPFSGGWVIVDPAGAG